jgi:hypothetical protein
MKQQASILVEGLNVPIKIERVQALRQKRIDAQLRDSHAKGHHSTGRVYGCPACREAREVAHT